ncbi:MAG: hypothetical protein ABI700_29070 [Chloroflexota bacterium]
MAMQRKHKIRAIRLRPVEDEMTPAERRELRRRYKEAHEHPLTAQQLRDMPDLFSLDNIEDEESG